MTSAVTQERLLERAAWFLVNWERAIYQIGDDPKSLLYGHSIVSWRALDIFYELTSVMAMPSARGAFIVYIVHQETCWKD